VRIRIATCALAAAAVGSLTACGGSLALDPVAQAATKTNAEQSFRFSFHASDGTPQGTMDGDGAYDAQGRLLRMSFDVPFGTGKKMRMDMLADSSKSLVMYVRMPLLTAFLPQGKSWVKVDVAEAMKAKGGNLAQMLQANESSPAQMLQALVHSKDSKIVGTEIVGGVETTHYKATVDPKDALLSQAKGSVPAQVDAALAKANLGRLPVEVWVGNDGLVRRLQVDLPRIAGAKAGFGGITFTEDMTAYGESVTVGLPADDSVVNAPGGKLP
jgi:hypothetical protein